MQHFACDVGAYIWPAYHYDPRAERFWPEKDGEWYTVRRGTPRFVGHDMPRIPLFGCQNEADPDVMREHVELALAHGVNVFIMDWYWYENQPCFERQLNEGLLAALDGTDARFYLMWANHNVDTLWNMHIDTDWSKPQQQLWSGRVSREQLEPMFDRLLACFLSHERYYRIAGRPVFSIFDFPNLIAGIGGIDETAETLAWMRERSRDAGLHGLHLQAIARTLCGVEGGAPLDDQGRAEAVRRLRFDSATAYQYSMDAGFSGDYVTWADQAIRQWEEHAALYGTWFPHVSVGWDNTHRNPSFGSDHVVTHATPDAFEACLWKARRYLETHPDQQRLVTINSWNEWTEGSYLLPDMRWGYRYLQAVRNVFG